MYQAQPSTTAPEAALRPLSGRKTATGVFDTWSEANLWERQTFTTELRWGVRYSQSDPIYYGLGSHFFAYAVENPLKLIDPLGLAACKPWDELFTLESEADKTKNGWWLPGGDIIQFANGVLPYKRGGGAIPESLVGKCCRVRVYSLYKTDETMYLRRCDCCADSAALNSSGDPEIQIGDSYQVPDNGPCEAIYQYGKRTLWKEPLKENYSNDVERGLLNPERQCVPIPRVGGQCPPASALPGGA